MKEGPATVASQKDRTVYPSFDIQDAHVDEFLQSHRPKLGDEIHAKVKLKVNHMSQSEHGKRIGFDVTEMHPAAKGQQAPKTAEVSDMLKRAMQDQT